MYVGVATVARSAAVAVARLARASTVLVVESLSEKDFTAFARGKCCPVVSLRLDFYLR